MISKLGWHTPVSHALTVLWSTLTISASSLCLILARILKNLKFSLNFNSLIILFSLTTKIFTKKYGKFADLLIFSVYNESTTKDKAETIQSLLSISNGSIEISRIWNLRFSFTACKRSFLSKILASSYLFIT